MAFFVLLIGVGANLFRAVVRLGYGEVSGWRQICSPVSEDDAPCQDRPPTVCAA
jgi:hypothetical protein